MGNLSEHFSRHEFACKDGCGRDTIDAETLALCEEVRKISGEPVVVFSGHRCLAYNTAVRGSVGSQHLYGRAADLHVRDTETVYAELCRRYPGKYGFGVYETFVHVDSRTNGPARWRG